MIGDLLRVRRARGCTAGVVSVAVPADNLYARVCGEPLGQGRRQAIRKHVNDLVPLQINEQGAVGLPAPETEIIDPEDAWRGMFRQVLRPDQSLQSIATGAFVQEGQPGLPQSRVTLGSSSGTYGGRLEEPRFHRQTLLA